ncbi:hypothetical protein ACFRAE_02050 [Sphingobacterium sp. HJSM2_6]|uniref:hypothetical protein n=1 Tax=Sphingobacterium sp. HJSM2_6 TaxID=3366264 RepID=UPI003BCEAE4B
MVQDPAAYEYLEEEINIIIHKLKFIPQENRPRVNLIVQNQANIDTSYITELLSVAGAQVQEQTQEQMQEDIVLFINDSDSFLNEIPKWLGQQVQISNAVANNQIYVIQKPQFAQIRENFLVDTEILAEIIQSKYFHYGHEGQYWIKFDLL